jgi:hypothetical protein
MMRGTQERTLPPDERSIKDGWTTPRSFRQGLSASLVGLFFWVSTLGAPRVLEARPPGGDQDSATQYLKEIAGAWKKALPPDQLLGIYFGRKWVGEATLGVSTAAGAEGAAFEISWTVETKISGQRVYTHDQVSLTRDLELVGAQSSEDGPDGKLSRSLSVQGGRWRMRSESKGKASYTDGQAKPGTTWNASFFPLLGLPEPSTVCLPVLDGDQTPVTLTVRLPEKKEAPGPAPEDSRILEVRRGEGPPALWRFSKDGRPLEFLSGTSPIRFRPIAPEDRGKDLKDPLVLSEPARTLIDLCRAVKRGDRVSVTGAFDFELLAQGLVSNYGKLDATSKRHLVDSLRAKTPSDLIAQRFRDGLPDESLMEDFFAWGSDASVKEDQAEVRLQGQSLVWKLHRAAEGAQKGKWLVSGFQAGSP